MQTLETKNKDLHFQCCFEHKQGIGIWRKVYSATD